MLGSLLSACLFGFLTACGSQPSSGDSPDTASSRVDPRIRLAFSGKTSGLPWLSNDLRFERTGRFPVYVRLAASRSAPELAGVEWLNHAKPIASGAFLARVDERGLALLEANPEVIRVESGIDVDELLLDAAVDDVEVTSARRRSLVVDGMRLDGTGRRIADIDSDAFVFHPGLFRADAGAYAWLDVDHDGRFAAGVDAIDVDRDSLASPPERALGLLVEKVDTAFQPTESHTDFRPDEDFVFIDSNQNGVRDFGAGFDENTPAFGEPLFVADDANENGVLEPSERVLRLGTSVYERIRDEDGNEFVRGSTERGIIDYGREVLETPERLSSSAHGTMMTGILAGGPFPAHRLAGVAPGADILLGAGRVRGESISWALELMPDAISMPFGQTVFTPLDGSSELEQLVDSAMKAGSIPVASAGNSAGFTMHAERTLPVGSSSFALTSSYDSQGLYFSVLFRRSVESLALSVTLPDGTIIDVPSESTSVPISVGAGRSLGFIAEVSSRGTHQRHIQLYAPSTFPIGKYALNAVLTDSEPLDVRVYSANDIRWGFTFDDYVTKSGTIGSPATADQALSVGGYAVHDGSSYGIEEKTGELEGFSSRGPRIDGFHPLDLAAPANPLSTTINSADPSSTTYQIWPGTSCSAPMVAGAIALLRQLHPDESAESIRDRIVSNARKDSFVTDDVDAWGQGKLDVAMAAGIEPASGVPPSVKLEVPPSIARGQKLTARVVVTDDGPATAIKSRWDIGYDGTYDTDWIASDEHVIDVNEKGPLALRVETHDSDGYVVGTTAVVEVTDGAIVTPPPTPPRETQTGDSSSCSASGPRTSSSEWFALVIAMMITAAKRRRRRCYRGTTHARRHRDD